MSFLEGRPTHESMEELSKESSDLAQAIHRLCNESDSGDVKVNALLSVLVDTLSNGGFTPLDCLRICHTYIKGVSSPLAQEKIEDYLRKF